MMKTYLKEKIGKPDLFVGRKKELAFFLKWIEGIPKEISMSTAEYRNAPLLISDSWVGWLRGSALYDAAEPV